MTLRVLHTADWHLGHSLHDISREEEHERFFEWLLDTLVDESIDALVRHPQRSSDLRKQPRARRAANPAPAFGPGPRVPGQTRLGSIFFRNRVRIHRPSTSTQQAS